MGSQGIGDAYLGNLVHNAIEFLQSLEKRRNPIDKTNRITATDSGRRTLGIGAATVFISEMAFFVASSSRVVSVVVASVAWRQSVEVSWFIH